MRSKTLYRKNRPNKTIPVQPSRSDSHIGNASQHPIPPAPAPLLLSPLPAAKVRPTKTKIFSSPSFPASAKKKNSKMRAIRHTLRKLKVLLHLRHGKKIPIPRIVLTPPSESESDGEEDDGEGSLGRYVVSDERMVSRLDLRLGQGGGD